MKKDTISEWLEWPVNSKTLIQDEDVRTHLANLINKVNSNISCISSHNMQSKSLKAWKAKADELLSDYKKFDKDIGDKKFDRLETKTLLKVKSKLNSAVSEIIRGEIEPMLKKYGEMSVQKAATMINSPSSLSQTESCDYLNLNWKMAQKSFLPAALETGGKNAVNSTIESSKKLISHNILHKRFFNALLPAIDGAIHTAVRDNLSSLSDYTTFVAICNLHSRAAALLEMMKINECKLVNTNPEYPGVPSPEDTEKPARHAYYTDTPVFSEEGENITKLPSDVKALETIIDSILSHHSTLDTEPIKPVEPLTVIETSPSSCSLITPEEYFPTGDTTNHLSIPEQKLPLFRTPLNTIETDRILTVELSLTEKGVTDRSISEAPESGAAANYILNKGENIKMMKEERKEENTPDISPSFKNDCISPSLNSKSDSTTTRIMKNSGFSHLNIRNIMSYISASPTTQSSTMNASRQQTSHSVNNKPNSCNNRMVNSATLRDDYDNSSENTPPLYEEAIVVNISTSPGLNHITRNRPLKPSNILDSNTKVSLEDAQSSSYRSVQLVTSSNNKSSNFQSSDELVDESPSTMTSKLQKEPVSSLSVEELPYTRDPTSSVTEETMNKSHSGGGLVNEVRKSKLLSDIITSINEKSLLKKSSSPINTEVSGQQRIPSDSNPTFPNIQHHGSFTKCEYNKNSPATQNEDTRLMNCAIEWLNFHLKKKKISVTNLGADISDGLNLIYALEECTGETIKKYVRKPMVPLFMLENINNALTFLVGKGVHTGSVTPNDVLEGNKSMILVLFGHIIRAFPITST